VDGAVFLDRDGVINRVRPDHVKSWAEFEFLPNVLLALARLRELGRRVVVITNQAAVGRRLLAPDDLSRIHRQMSLAVQVAGGQIDAIYVCPHLPDSGCGCRKPGAGLFLQASAELKISLAASVMVGDTESDILAARSAGCFPILITPFPLASLNGVAMAADLAGAVTLIERLIDQVQVISC
jgi:histidinol-phosphate phosphatase family protein